MSSNIKFSRNYIVEIEIDSNNSLFIQLPFTFKFDIIRNTFASSNTGDFIFFNLPKSIRNSIYKDIYDTKKRFIITVIAGYEEESGIIFKGQILSSESYREGTEFITKIRALDGGLDIYGTTSFQTIAKGESKEEAVKRLASGFTDIKDLTIGSFPGIYKRGIVFNGNTWENLKRETNNKIFIDNLKMNILSDNEVIKGGLLTINTDTGLLNSPRRSNTQIVFKILFEPRLVVAQLVNLESITNDIFNGEYKISGIKHSGTISDAVSDKCETEVSLFLGSQALEIVN